MSGEKVLVASLPIKEALKLLKDQSGGGPSVSQSRGGRRGRGQVQHGRVTKTRPKGKGPRHPQKTKPKKPTHAQAVNTKEEQPAPISTPAPIPDYPTSLWNGFQLMGDSVLTRMLESVSDQRSTYDQNLKCKRLGYLFGGQTVCQLVKNLQDGQGGPVHSKVLVVIGTNDVTKNVPVHKSAEGLAQLKTLLESKTTETVFCLVPPVPKKNVMSPVLNTLIKGKFGEKSTVIDTNQIFIKEKKIDTGLFIMKHPSGAIDAVHPNKKGLEKLAAFIEKEIKELVEIENEDMMQDS